MWSGATGETVSATQFKKTVKHDPHANVPIMRSAPGHSQYNLFYAATEEATKDDTEMMCCFANAANNTAFSLAQPLEPSFEPIELYNLANKSEGEQPPPEQGELKDTPVLLDFHDDEFTQEAHPAPDETDVKNPTAELLAWHYRLSHTPFTHLQAMAKQRIIPKRMATCSVPKCPACLYGKATQRAW